MDRYGIYKRKHGDSGLKSVNEINMNTKNPRIISFVPKPVQDRGASPAPPSQTQAHGGGLLSKFFGRANMLLASFFSKSQYENPAPTCPGAFVQDQRTNRFVLHTFPRTPYSRTITNSFQQTLKQVHSKKTKPLNGNHGSVGPIRRLRHKFHVETLSRGSVNLNCPKKDYWSSNSEALFSAPKQNLENGPMDSQCTKPQHTELFTPGVPAQSTLVARKILEHIDTLIDKVNAVATASDIKVATALTHGHYAQNLNAQHKGANEDSASEQKIPPPTTSTAKPVLPDNSLVSAASSQPPTSSFSLTVPSFSFSFSSTSSEEEDDASGIDIASFPVSAASSEPEPVTVTPTFSLSPVFLFLFDEQ